MNDFLSSLSAHQAALEALQAHERYGFSSFAREMPPSALEAIQAHERYGMSHLVREIQEGFLGTASLRELAVGSLPASALEGLSARDRLLGDFGFLDRTLESVRVALTNAPSVMHQLMIDQGDPLFEMTAALGTASWIQGLDRGVLNQSMTAAAIVWAARSDASIYDQILGRSFAFDALLQIENFQQEVDYEADFEGPFEALLEGILSHFAIYIKNARTGFEINCLIQMLGLLLMAVSLIVNIDSRTVAIKSLEVAQRALDESDRDLGDIRDALDNHTSIQNEHATNIVELLRQIRDAMEERKMAADEAARYIVKRQVALKAEQRMRSDTIAILFPNQVVRLITRRGKWIEVEYYDHLAGSTRSGWVIKKYLHMIR